MLSVNLVSCHVTETVYQLCEFPCQFSGSLMYTIISSADSESLTSSFPSCIPLIFLCCLIALAKTLSTMLSGQPYLVPKFSGIVLSFFPFNLMFAFYLLYIAFIIVRYVPCIPDLSKTFILKEYCNLPMLFQHLMRWSYVFSFTLFIWWITSIDFYMLNYRCVPGMKPTWSWWMIPQGHLLNCVHSSIIHNSQNLETTWMLLNSEWIKKMWHIYIMECYSAVKKQWHLEICMQMDGTRKKPSWVRYPRPT